MSGDDSVDEDPEADRNDPFDRLGYDTDREGDPFERLDDGSDAAAGDGTGPANGDGTGPADDDPWVPPGEDRRDSAPGDGWNDTASADAPATDAGSTSSPTNDADADPAPIADPSDPFANVDTPTESPFDGGESVFERVDAGAADPDQVWESITSEDDGDDAEPSVPDEGRYSDVSKHRFCEQCEHFSPPPNVSCGHHAAEIIEFLDMETVRLLDCPVVAEHEELEQGE